MYKSRALLSLFPSMAMSRHLLPIITIPRYQYQYSSHELNNRPFPNPPAPFSTNNNNNNNNNNSIITKVGK
jgi:hypothetical protein